MSQADVCCLTGDGTRMHYGSLIHDGPTSKPTGLKGFAADVLVPEDTIKDLLGPSLRAVLAADRDLHRMRQVVLMMWLIYYQGQFSRPRHFHLITHRHTHTHTPPKPKFTLTL